MEELTQEEIAAMKEAGIDVEEHQAERDDVLTIVRTERADRIESENAEAARKEEIARRKAQAEAVHARMREAMASLTSAQLTRLEQLACEVAFSVRSSIEQLGPVVEKELKLGHDQALAAVTWAIKLGATKAAAGMSRTLGDTVASFLSECRDEFNNMRFLPPAADPEPEPEPELPPPSALLN